MTKVKVGKVKETKCLPSPGLQGAGWEEVTKVKVDKVQQLQRPQRRRLRRRFPSETI